MNILDVKYSNIVEIGDHTNSNTYTVKTSNDYHKKGSKVTASPILTTTIKIYAKENENLDEKIANTQIINNENNSQTQSFANKTEVLKIKHKLKDVSLDDLAYMKNMIHHKNQKIEYRENTNEKAYEFILNLFLIKQK